MSNFQGYTQRVYNTLNPRFTIRYNANFCPLRFTSFRLQAALLYSFMTLMRPFVLPASEAVFSFIIKELHYSGTCLISLFMNFCHAKSCSVKSPAASYPCIILDSCCIGAAPLYRRQSYFNRISLG